MKRLRGSGYLVPGLLLVLLFSLAACSKGTPEAELRAQLEHMQEAASQRRAGDLMEGVSADFTGNQGMDRVALHNMLRLLMLRNTDIGVRTGPVQVEMRGESAVVQFHAVLTGGSGRLIPERARAYSINSGWRREAGRWRLYYADWKPLSGASDP